LANDHADCDTHAADARLAPHHVRLLGNPIHLSHALFLIKTHCDGKNSRIVSQDSIFENCSVLILHTATVTGRGFSKTLVFKRAQLGGKFTVYRWVLAYETYVLKYGFSLGKQAPDF
jgi:hypothetical protein